MSLLSPIRDDDPNPIEGKTGLTIQNKSSNAVAPQPTGDFDVVVSVRALHHILWCQGTITTITRN
jgi:hypothetical protein